MSAAHSTVAKKGKWAPRKEVKPMYFRAQTEDVAVKQKITDPTGLLSAIKNGYWDLACDLIDGGSGMLAADSGHAVLTHKMILQLKNREAIALFRSALVKQQWPLALHIVLARRSPPTFYSCVTLSSVLPECTGKTYEMLTIVMLKMFEADPTTVCFHVLETIAASRQININQKMRAFFDKKDTLNTAYVRGNLRLFKVLVNCGFDASSFSFQWAFRRSNLRNASSAERLMMEHLFSSGVVDVNDCQIKNLATAKRRKNKKRYGEETEPAITPFRCALEVLDVDAAEWLINLGVTVQASDVEYVAFCVDPPPLQMRSQYHHHPPRPSNASTFKDKVERANRIMQAIVDSGADVSSLRYTLMGRTEWWLDHVSRETLTTLVGEGAMISLFTN